MLARHISKALRRSRLQNRGTARYSSAMAAYTPTHRARHQELAWHAATKQAEKAIEAEDVLESIASSSKTTTAAMDAKSTLNRSGSAAATNLPFVNGISQKREFSTTNGLGRKKQASVGEAKVKSSEATKTDTTFPTPTHTSSQSVLSASSSTINPARQYSSKAEKTPEQKHLDDEEHRLAEGLVKGDNLMNQDEGMNPNEDKEGLRIHPTHKRHHKSKRTGKNDGGSMPTTGPASPTPKAKSYSTKAGNGGKEPVDETGKDRLLDRNVLKPEHYEYTRSGTDGEMGDDPEAYCREHVHPEDELNEEQTMKKEHNPLEFSPANPEISKPPKEGEQNVAARGGEKRSGMGKSRKGHVVGKGTEKKISGEPGL